MNITVIDVWNNKAAVNDPSDNTGHFSSSSEIIFIFWLDAGKNDRECFSSALYLSEWDGGHSVVS